MGIVFAKNAKTKVNVRFEPERNTKVDLLYLNVYAVTRHYGGPQEGGWWFDMGEPLASVPIKAKREKGHPSYCGRCSDARRGDGEFCRDTPEEPEYEQAISDYIWSWSAGTVKPGTDEYKKLEEAAVEAIEKNSPECYHLVPVSVEELSSRRKELEEMFADQNEGNIGSVLGGTEIRIACEDHMAVEWPSCRPRYE